MGCAPSGLSIVNGGTYYINPASPSGFSFDVEFPGCGEFTYSKSISISGPNGEVYSCGGYSTWSSGGPFEIYCNGLNHNNMEAGAWQISIDNSDNSWYYRNINIVTTQAVITNTLTPTFTGSVTPTISSIFTTTDTIVVTETLPAVTVTSPALVSGTLQIVPVALLTNTVTRYKTTHAKAKASITSTRTIIPHCTTPVVPVAILDVKGSAAPTVKPKKSKSTKVSQPTKRAYPIVIDRQVQKRDEADGPLTIYTVVTAASVYTVETEAAVIVSSTATVDVVSTSTSTPAPSTVFSGTVPTTVTMPTSTKTITQITTNIATVTDTKTTTFRQTILLPQSAC